MTTRKSKTKPSNTSSEAYTFLDVKNDSTGILSAGNGVCAFDPGDKGAFAIFNQNRFSIFPNRYYSPNSLRKILYNLKYHVVERVSARPGQGVVSMFKFGMEYQKCLSACEVNANGDQYYVGHVSPQTWQNWYKNNFFLEIPIGKDSQRLRKLALLEMAKKLGLAQAYNPMGVTLLDAADAYLILQYTMRYSFGYR